MRRLAGAVVVAAACLAVPAHAAPPPRCVGATPLVTDGHASCVHADVYDVASAARWRAVPPATAPVRCYGDGTTGSRVQLLYGYVAGHPDRTAAVTKTLRLATAPRMQAVIDAQSGGKDLGIRFAFDRGCTRLSIPTVRLPASADTGTPDDRFRVIIETLRGLGYTRTDRKYQVVLDGFTSDGVCGLGELAATMDQPHPANVHDGPPTAGARTDVVSTAGVEPVEVPRYSVVFKSTFGPRGPSCWDLGQSHASVYVHELFHTLGAVQLSAPHSDGGGHCTDTPSVMCPVRSKAAVPDCGRQPVEVLDCGMDDYWNPAPATGSYLAGADNIATSVFFGPQPQDRLAASPV